VGEDNPLRSLHRYPDGQRRYDAADQSQFMTNEERQAGVAALWHTQNKTLRFAPAHEAFEDAMVPALNGSPPSESIINVFGLDDLQSQCGLLGKMFSSRFNLTVFPEVMDRRRWQEFNKSKT
jgi:hypothetical protein